MLKEIKEDFLVVYEKDPALHSKFELFFNYPGVWAIFYYRIAHKLHKNGWKRTSRMIMGLSQILTHIDIHPAATIGKRVFIDHGIGVVIGETSVIGNDVTIYQGVTLGGVSLEHGKRHPTIEDDVAIGSGAKVLGNITIGKCSKVGANSVVIQDVPPYSTVVGVPGRIIHRRDQDPFSHNKLPDINRKIFEYLIHRINVLENAIISGEKDIIEKDQELDEKYKEYIKSMKKEKKNESIR